MKGLRIVTCLLVISYYNICVTGECTDLLSPSNTVDIFDVASQADIAVDSCSTVIQKYLSECKKETFSSEDGYCCDSCNMHDLTCIDSTCISWTFQGEKVLCEKLIEVQPAYCNQALVKQECCGSCETACYDHGDFKKTIKVKVKGDKVKCEDCTCKKLKTMDAKFLKKACKKKVLKANCCKRCTK